MANIGFGSLTDQLLGGKLGFKGLAKMIFIIEFRTKKLSKAAKLQNLLIDLQSFLPFVTGGVKQEGTLKSKRVFFPVMYNPESLKLAYETAYNVEKTINDDEPIVQFSYEEPTELEVELFFDATAASQSNGLFNITSDIAELAEGIDVLVIPLLNALLKVNPDTHEPNYVTIQWGSLIYKGVAEKADVNYTMFDRAGRPIRGTVAMTFKSSPKDIAKKKTESPDLTKIKIVSAGDTLPLLAQEEYGDESLYIELAQANNLKNYRKLVPGQKLIFPPLSKSE